MSKDCACHTDDARLCFMSRYPPELMLGEPEEDNREVCCCSCHDEQEEDYDEGEAGF